MQISKSIKPVPRIFALALTIAEILIFEIFDFEKIDQSIGTFAMSPFDSQHQNR